MASFNEPNARDGLPSYWDINDSRELRASQSTLEIEDDILVSGYRALIPPEPAFPITPRRVLRSPILIPQSSLPSFGQPPAPFLRAYPPDLGARNIPPALFLAILDTLNICLAPPAPLQALHAVGQGMGMVPYHWAQFASAGIGLASGAGTAVVRVARTKRFLERVNSEVFNPRGLKMETVRDDKAMELLGLTGRNSMTAQGFDDALHLSKSVPLARLKQLAPHIAQVTFDVPPPTQQDNILDQISAKQTAAKLAKTEKKSKKEEEKWHKERRKVAEKYNYRLDSTYAPRDSDASDLFSVADEMARLDDEVLNINAIADSKLDRLTRKSAEKVEKKRAKDLEEVEKDRQKLLEKQEKVISKARGQEQRLAEKGREKMAKLEWIMILDL